MRGLLRQDARRPLPPRHAVPEMARRQETKGMHLRPARLTSAAVAVVLIAAACTNNAPVHSHLRAQSSISPATSTTHANQSGVSATDVVIRFRAPISLLALGTNSIYALY